jgi:hypothetical protein
MQEIGDPTIYPRTYWFVDHVNQDGTRVIGPLGVYYELINFLGLLFSLVVVATFLSLFRLVIDIGRSLQLLHQTQELTTPLLRQRLTVFTQGYLWGKLSIVAYMANAYVWKSSQARSSVNLDILGVVLTLFGVVFLSLPRYYLELQWYELRVAERPTAPDSVDYDDLRPSQVPFLAGRSWKPRLIANAADALLISGFLTSFWTGR